MDGEGDGQGGLVRSRASNFRQHARWRGGFLGGPGGRGSGGAPQQGGGLDEEGTVVEVEESEVVGRRLQGFRATRCSHLDVVAAIRLRRFKVLK